MLNEDTTALQRRIDIAMKRTDDAYNRAAKVLGLSPSALDILYALYVEGEGCTQTQLCAMSYSNKQTVNSSIHKLERDGIVRLEAGIGRSTLVYLTDQGKELAREKIGPVVAAETASIEALTPQEREATARAIERYVDVLVEKLDAIGDNAEEGRR